MRTFPYDASACRRHHLPWLLLLLAPSLALDLLLGLRALTLPLSLSELAALLGFNALLLKAPPLLGLWFRSRRLRRSRLSSDDQGRVQYLRVRPELSGEGADPLAWRFQVLAVDRAQLEHRNLILEGRVLRQAVGLEDLRPAGAVQELRRLVIPRCYEGIEALNAEFEASTGP